MANHFDFHHLPFDSEVVENTEDKTLIRAKLKCEEDAEAWMRAYQSLSATKWNVRNTYPRLQRLSYRKDYVCHHSAFHKVNKTNMTLLCLSFDYVNSTHTTVAPPIVLHIDNRS